MKKRAVEGLSARAFARAKGVSRTAVRDAVRAGKLKVLRDGKIVADQEWIVTRGPKTSAQLVDARRASLVAVLLDLRDEVDGLRSNLITPQAIHAALNAALIRVATAVLAILPEIPSKPTRKIMDALIEAAFAKVRGPSTGVPVTRVTRAPTADADTYFLESFDDLVTERANLQAEKRELKRGLRVGGYIERDEALHEVSVTISGMRSTLLAARHATTRAEAVLGVMRAVNSLTGQWATAEELGLKATRDAPGKSPAALAKLRRSLDATLAHAFEPDAEDF